uniref:uncharacterized protein LOC113179197 isoform X2 n=1 Tax=Urocitellus parryii TaxID=9999 RepID=UPI000E560740|nr:uncharacterized protein LOC113179197 isoform X2 [Urocitellus parryii]
MAEKQSHRLQSITPPASPSLPGGNLQGPSGFEGRGQEETLNSGSTEDKERLPYILFLPGFSSSASYPPSPQNKLISLSTTKGNGTRTQRDVYQPLCAEPHLLDAERRAPLPERQLSADCWSRRFHSLRTDEGTKGLYAAHLPEPETWRLARPWNTLSAVELDGQDCSSWAQLDSWPAGLPAAPHLLSRGKFLTRWTTPALEDLPSSLGRAEARQRPDSKATIPALCVPGAPRGRGPCCRRLAAPQHSGAWSGLQGQSASQRRRRRRRSPRGVRDSCPSGCTLQLPGQRPLPTRPQPSPASCSGCWEALSPHMREHALRHTRPSQAPLRGPAAAGGCTECCQVLRSTASPHPRPLLLSCLEV